MNDTSTTAPPAVTVSASARAQVPTAPRHRLLGLVSLVVFLAVLFAPGQLLAGDKYWLPLFSRYMALAIFAVSVDLVWGYTGLLSLGQGLYFGLGAYAVGYSLKLQSAALSEGKPFVASPDMALPDFMEYCRLPAVPGWVAPLINIWLALAVAVVLPAVVAALFGLVTFWRRIKGVYFSLITQGLVLAVFTLIVCQQPYTGGVVGMTNLARLRLFGHPFHMLSLYNLITAVLVVCFLISLALVRSKFGKVLTAIRDSEYRVLALGYNTAMYKTFVFALAGGMAGLAGALFVSAMGTAGPDRFGIGFSIEIVILVAVGGRGTLVGAVLGAVLVSFANTYLNDNNQLAWLLVFLLSGGVSVGAVVAAGRWLVVRKGVSPVGRVLGVAAVALLCAALGYVLLTLGRDYSTGDLSDKQAWPIILGALFILVVVFLPEGIIGGLQKLAASRRFRRTGLAASSAKGV